MVTSKSNISSASNFAPSPPLSASAGASDSELETATSLPNRQRARPRKRTPTANTKQRRTSGVEAGLWQRQEYLKANVSPSSSSGTSHPRPRSVPSAASSFATDGQEGQEDCDQLDTAYSLIKASWEGRLPADLQSAAWHVLDAAPPEYDELCKRLQNDDPRLLDYFINHLRCDYDPKRNSLTLRLMATTLHEYLQDTLCFHIRTELNRVASESGDPVLQELASSIESHGHAKVTLGQAEARRSPDGQFHFWGATAPDNAHRPWVYKLSRFPQFVVEIAYSQGAKDLENLAKDYYEESAGKIKSVLTIDVEYAATEKRRAIAASRDNHPGSDGYVDRKAAFSFYRGPKRIHRDRVFRDSSGRPVAAKPLQLALSDFVPDRVLQQLSRQSQRRVKEARLNLTMRQLYDFVEAAERRQDLQDARSPASESDSEPEIAAPSSSRKRKCVQWDLAHETDNDEDSDDHSSGKDEDEDAQEGQHFVFRSKRQKTSDVLPERRRTRSMSRLSEGVS